MKRHQIHHSLYVLFLSALCFAIPLSKYVMSMMMIFLAANWLVEGGYSQKIERIKHQKSVLLFLLFMLVFCLGFIRADSFLVALDYWTCKLPLFLAPVIIASSEPLKRRELGFALSCFVSSVLFASLYSVIYYATHDVMDIREISVFISHIRFSLCVDVAIVLLLFVAVKLKSLHMAFRCLALLAVLWLCVYLFVAQTLTGVVLLVLVALAYVFYVLFKCRENRIYRVLASAVLVLLVALTSYILVLTYQYFHIIPETYAQVDKETVNGNKYTHDWNSMVENGSVIGMYVCDCELESTWPQRSRTDVNDPTIRPTLIRYLNSCHLRKDSVGVMSLSEQDVKNIENGIANVYYTSRFGMRRALYPIFFSVELYLDAGIVDNSTLLQRLAYWDAGWKQLKKNWGLGVGLGNHKSAVVEQLREDGRNGLSERGGVACHNQWLTLWLMGGIAVFLTFLMVLIYPFVEQKNKISFVYVAFFIILVGSMFTEDTLETEVGLTLFAIMNALLLYGFNLNHHENA